MESFVWYYWIFAFVLDGPMFNSWTLDWTRYSVAVVLGFWLFYALSCFMFMEWDMHLVVGTFGDILGM